MFLTDIEAAVRQDLFDPAGSNQHWATADLDRAIDKAIDRYSQYYPNIAYNDLATQPYQRTYPYPVPWNPAYPVWWLERIIYPLQAYGSAFTPPLTGPGAAAITGSQLNVGSYQYAITLLTQGGETTRSPASTVNTTTSNQAVLLTAISTGGNQASIVGNTSNTIIGRNIYRTLVGGTIFYWLATLADATSTSYSDTTTDSVLASRSTAPSVNTSGVMLWPPFERDFAEYSNLFDSTTALAAGGNMGVQGTVGTGQGPTGTLTPSFTLKLNNAELPKDNTLLIRIFYATKHQLDANGSTLPEAHRDIVVLGACAYAMEAYQVPTNDNFEFQDGSLHDRIDDTKIPQAWLAATQTKMQRFEARLQEVKQQRDFAYGARIHWGDIPTHWNRL